MFINRRAELSMLEKMFRGGRAEFIVIYGRRRVGKTALLLEFLTPEEERRDLPPREGDE